MLLAISSQRKVGNGTFIGRSGAPVTQVLILIKGFARVYGTAESGKESTIALVGPGDHVGVMSLLTNTIRTDDVIATCSSHVLAIDATDFQKLLQRSASLSTLTGPPIKTNLSAPNRTCAVSPDAAASATPL